MFDAATSTTRPIPLETSEQAWLELVPSFEQLSSAAAAQLPDSRGLQGLFFALNVLLQLQFPAGASANVCPYGLAGLNFIRTLVETGTCLCVCYAMFALAAAEEVGLDDAVLLLMMDRHVTVVAVEPRTQREPVLFGSSVVGTPLAVVESGFEGNVDHLRLKQLGAGLGDPKLLSKLVHESLRERVHVQEVKSVDSAYEAQNYWLPVKCPWPAVMELLSFASFKSARRHAQDRETYARVLGTLFEIPELAPALELTKRGRKEHGNEHGKEHGDERSWQASARGAAVQLCAAHSDWPVNGKLLNRLVSGLRDYWHNT
jgi:hypothetical protein